MAHPHSDPAAAIPDADQLEQQHPLAPSALTDPTEDELSAASALAAADEADLLEQHSPLPSDDDDDDYPHRRDTPISDA